MPERFVRVRGIDPLLFRDGRPFSAEIGSLSAQTLPLPLPGTLAGFVRSRVGERTPGWRWDRDGVRKALDIPVHGPIPLRGDAALLPAPRDALVYGDEAPKVMPLRPRRENAGGCDLPEAGLSPLAVTREVKPAPGYHLWPWERLTEWLASPTGENFPPPENVEGLPREERVHVAIDRASGASAEGKLFTVRFLGFEKHRWERFAGTAAEHWSLLVRIGNGGTDLSGAGVLGGERRLAEITPESDSLLVWPHCPDTLKAALKKTRRVRLVLATPALFDNGWKPGWLGTGLFGLRLRLVAAAVGRREPVSGWDFPTNAPKPVRWMVPAGSVFFFAVEDGDPGVLAEEACWLRPVSDKEQDRRDGYGLALWGTADW